MNKTGKIGFVAPHPIPEVIRHINAFALGVRSVKPSAAVHIVWTGAWFDPGKERDAAVALMDAGCDIIATGADSPASMQAAEKRGFYSFGYDSDGRAFAPKSFLTAPIWDWSVIYNDIVKKVKEGFTDWENLDYWDGLESGIVKLAPLSDLVPDDVREIAEARTEELKKDDNIFVGPIKDQSGAVKVKDGVKLTDAELLSMMWFVEGVVGNIPE
jgi:basic membrane protein A